MDLQDIPRWTVAAAAVFALAALLAALGVVFLFTLRWRGRPRAATRQTETADREVGVRAQGAPTGSGSSPAPQHGDPAGTEPARVPDPGPLAVAVRRMILQATAGRCAAGARALLLSPPPHPRQMTWHLHLGADVALDLFDGRTVPTRAPATSQNWTLPSGLRAGLADGDPAPAPGEETRVVRVSGPYVSVTHLAGTPPSFQVRVAAGPGPAAEYQTDGDEVLGLASVLDRALAEAVSRSSEDSTAMGYSLASWTAHERAWLRVVGLPSPPAPSPSRPSRGEGETA